ncbi:carbamoyltransferase HypF [Aldersonia sp. NBC_00410]|uniref:carbamoyltransferase HypF n=1 Tax=Aldersonia sp. NBC_00410 TaxID=2975954 RepID=UPI00224D1DC4|nr:carbamoyltransferase HypF [Aldersonia sp. NBC_00410]MCX5042148.1 carbamoyltransferase HypF [Aldersonia sp. NBC_00410]
MSRGRRRIEVRGVVQGVGFRPFVYTTAAALGLSGSVRNDPSGALIEIEGETDNLDAFVHTLASNPPPLAVIESLTPHDLPACGGTGFHIADTNQHGAGRTLASPDVAMCADCGAELRDPTNRRYRHPFINCTNCGPRFTIIAALPYDRPSTSMSGFAMCADCAREYADPADRRFHAQPICCPNCGPTLRFGDLTGDAALAAARDLIRDGKVLAVKGIGGYHLACDATDDGTVTTLRERKRRGDKPFAVMARDLDTARTLVDIDDDRLLTGAQRPIVLLPRRQDAPVAAAVAPHNPDLGVMLPYAPLHELLLDGPMPDALVMTSGNLAGEPICHADDDARERLAGIADGLLRHDRPILVPCDDSVLRPEFPLRRSRGYAPLPVALPVPVAPTLAVGGDLKNTFALADGRYAWLSGHIGDMDDLATLSAFATAEQHLERLTGVTPTLLVTDAHPRYRSADWARRHAGARPVRTVQHHHAHIAAVMAEHGLDGSQRVTGLAFDGTGYGPDGAVWGGEALLADYKGFHRLAHLAYVPLAGGDLAVRRPYRMALAHLHAAGIKWDDDMPAVAACPPEERRVLAHQLDTGLRCVPTSSMGRLFDAVAALAGVRQISDYEAQAAIEFEGVGRGIAAGAYEFGLGTESFDPAAMLRAIVHDVRTGVAPGVISARFHEAVAQLIVALAERAGQHTVALSGGVFQNPTLLRRTTALLSERGFDVLTHQRVPPNDGGLALGQLMVGNAS